MPLSSQRGRARRRPATRLEQLDLWRRPGADPPLESQGRPDLEPTTVRLRHPSCARALDLVRQVRLFFPELDGLTLRVGLTRSAAGFASREELWIWLNPRRLVRHTIAHELVHLLQNRGLVPTGEKPADLHALARHPILVDDLPSYLSVPRLMRLYWSAARPAICTLLHQTARDALNAREEGERYYLAWFEREIRARWAHEAPRLLPAREPALQESLFG